MISRFYTVGWILFLCLSSSSRVALASASASALDSEEDEEASSIAVGAYFVHKTVIIPHDGKIHRGGEDAAGTSDRLLVVADGVGGWAKQNINPGLYSKLLTKSVVELGHLNMTLPLVDLVHKANWVAADAHLGSATCTTLKLTGINTIQTLNIGDSGYSIHRRNPQDNDKLQVMFATTPGQKRFNFPHQIGGKYGDTVREVGVEASHTLEPDDIVVVYSDGVSDNLFPKQFHECLDASVDDEYELQSFSLAADCIARKAYFLGKDKSFDSPFAQGAREAGWGANYSGGKHDDITVVVAQIRAGDIPQPLEDPYLEESIFLYTGAVEAIEALPKLEDLSKQTVREEL